jgi:hypothetical protein
MDRPARRFGASRAIMPYCTVFARRMQRVTTLDPLEEVMAIARGA